MATKTSETRNQALKILKASKEVLSKKEVTSKLKKLGDHNVAVQELKKKAIDIPKQPKLRNFSLGDVTGLEGPALGRKYAEFVEYYNWISYEAAIAEIEETNGDIIFDHTFSVVLLENIIQQLTSREDRDAAAKSHRETITALVDKSRCHTKAHMMRAISNGLLKKVDALSREITRRQGFEKHYARKNTTF